MNVSPRSPVRVAAAAAGGLLLTYVVAVLTPLGQHLDTSVMVLTSALVSNHQWAQLVLDQESTVTMVALATALTAVVAFARGGWQAFVVALTSVGTVLSAEALKEVLARPALLTDNAANSLPSGHVAAIAGLAVAAVLAATGRLRNAMVAIGLAAVGLTGLATVTLEWHRPSDVLAAALLAITVGSLIHALTITLAETKRRSLPRPPRRPIQTTQRRTYRRPPLSNELVRRSS